MTGTFTSGSGGAALDLQTKAGGAMA